jgi:hypothetical protein
VTAFTVTRTVAAPVDVTWARVSAFADHGEAIPLTRMRLDPGEPTVGWEFTGRTGVGPVEIADTMIVTAFDPPSAGGAGRFRIVKIGRWLRGWAEVVVEPTDSGGSRVHWTEDLGPRIDPFPRLSGRVSAWAGQRLFAHTLDRLLRPRGE